MIYFFVKVDDRSHVKIGFATNVDARVRGQTPAYGEIELIATMVGDKSVERLVHYRFHKERQEGEWFRLSEELSQFMRDECKAESRIFKPKSTSFKVSKSGDAINADKMAAKELVTACLGRYPSTMPVGAALEAVFLELAEINPVWTRRRVRAILDSVGRRIDLFEIIDMLNLLDVPRDAWATWMRPLGTVVPLRAQTNRQGASSLGTGRLDSRGE